LTPEVYLKTSSEQTDSCSDHKLCRFLAHVYVRSLITVRDLASTVSSYDRSVGINHRLL